MFIHPLFRRYCANPEFIIAIAAIILIALAYYLSK